jgi:hypothetical protein
MVGFDMILAIRCTGPSALGDGGLVERGTHAGRQLQGVVIGPEVDEHAGIFVEHVAVDRGDLDVAGAQGPDEGIDLVAGDQEVARDCE